jgi:hypothetical protein
MQDVIPLFDLLVILAVLASAGTAARIAYLLIRRRSAQARHVATRWAICTFLYVSVSLTVSAARPQRSIGVGDRWCFDDWCVSVDSVRRQPSGGQVMYLLNLRAYNAAGRAQRALYPWMFLRDEADRHFAPDGNRWISDVEASIPPHESHQFDVAFHVPSDARQLAFVTNHGSGKPCSLLPSILVIGQGRCLFHKYDSIRLE